METNILVSGTPTMRVVRITIPENVEDNTFKSGQVKGLPIIIKNEETSNCSVVVAIDRVVFDSQDFELISYSFVNPNVVDGRNDTHTLLTPNETKTLNVVVAALSWDVSSDPESERKQATGTIYYKPYEVL